MFLVLDAVQCRRIRGKQAEGGRRLASCEWCGADGTGYWGTRYRKAPDWAGAKKGQEEKVSGWVFPGGAHLLYKQVFIGSETLSASVLRGGGYSPVGRSVGRRRRRHDPSERAQIQSKRQNRRFRRTRRGWPVERQCLRDGRSDPTRRHKFVRRGRCREGGGSGVSG
jgi:hypothetical protein